MMNEQLIWIMRAALVVVALWLLWLGRRRQLRAHEDAARREEQRIAVERAEHVARAQRLAASREQADSTAGDTQPLDLGAGPAEARRLDGEALANADLEREAGDITRRIAGGEASRLATADARHDAERAADQARIEEEVRLARERAEREAAEAAAARRAEEAEAARVAAEARAQEEAEAAARQQAELDAAEAAARLAAEAAAAQAQARERAEREAAEAQAAAEAAAALAAEAAEAARLAEEARTQAERQAAAEAAQAAAAAQAAEAAREAAAAATRPLRADETLVLVADDSKIVRVKLSRLLAGQGYRVVLAESGEQAVALMAAEQPHVLITDVEMPGIDGFELTRLVRAAPATTALPVLMITSSDDKHEAAAAAGVTQLLGKPFSEKALLAAIEQARLAVRVPA